MKWKKLGQVFDLSKYNNNSWMKEQAQNPFSVDMGDFVRVYFNTRAEKDEKGLSKSLAGFVDLEKDNLSNIINISSKPILKHGNLGEFDEFGIMSGSVLKMKEEYYLYYVGWTRKLSVPYDWTIGLAKSSDNGRSFKRFGKGPILAATSKEPYLQAGCSSIIKVGNLYHLWYTSGIKWIKTEKKAESVYQIMHATSKDGINWVRNGVPIIKGKFEDEAQASPSIIKIKDKWHMVFSFRHSVNFRNKERGYRLGYAWSNDLKTWHRDDSKMNLKISESGWDSEMICYPHFSKINGKVHIFYCGNDFGKYGFGAAVLE